MAQYTTNLVVLSRRSLPIASLPRVSCHGEPLSYSRSKTKVNIATPAKHAARSSVPNPVPPPNVPAPHNPRNMTGARQMNATFDRTTLCGWSDSQQTRTPPSRNFVLPHEVTRSLLQVRQQYLQIPGKHWSCFLKRGSMILDGRNDDTTCQSIIQYRLYDNPRATRANRSSLNNTLSYRIGVIVTSPVWRPP